MGSASLILKEPLTSLKHMDLLTSSEHTVLTSSQSQTLTDKDCLYRNTVQTKGPFGDVSSQQRRHSNTRTFFVVALKLIFIVTSSDGTEPVSIDIMGTLLVLCLFLSVRPSLYSSPQRRISISCVACNWSFLHQLCVFMYTQTKSTKLWISLPFLYPRDLKIRSSFSCLCSLIFFYYFFFLQCGAIFPEVQLDWQSHLQSEPHSSTVLISPPCGKPVVPLKNGKYRYCCISAWSSQFKFCRFLSIIKSRCCLKV